MYIPSQSWLFSAFFNVRYSGGFQGSFLPSKVKLPIGVAHFSAYQAKYDEGSVRPDNCYFRPSFMLHWWELSYVCFRTEPSDFPT